MRCENCQAELTFFMALRQAVPYRFRCFRCNARYRVRAPRLGLFLLGMTAAFVALAYEFATGMSEHGASYILPFMTVAVLVWLLFEYLLHRHIASNGRLVRMGVRKADLVFDDDAGPAGPGDGDRP
ncbi:MAG TPA: hypothetical protein PKM41_01125 [Deltaproteobacteria bacterium]|nr:hypothetical protein [Deltaproteobacteria bacterium]HOI06683.1 hypothetical protein [Deltaproteobacteria bacterium]